MNLTLDIGNSRCKAARFDQTGRMTCCRAVDWQSDWASLLDDVDSCIVSSVASPEVTDACLQRLNGRRCVMLSADLELPIALGYDTKTTLGADRIALAAAVAERKRAMLVADIGTCMTVDLVDSKALFHGGAIAPGIDMRFRAMHEGTARLPLITNARGCNHAIGSTTEESMLSGVLMAMRYELEGFYTDLLKIYPDLGMVLTGGGAKTISSLLQVAHEVDENLVMKGLNIILELNKR